MPLETLLFFLSICKNWVPVRCNFTATSAEFTVGTGYSVPRQETSEPLLTQRMFFVQEYSIHCQFMYTIFHASNVVFTELPVHKFSHFFFLRFDGLMPLFLHLFFFIQYSRYIHTAFIHKHSLTPISISSQLSAQWRNLPGVPSRDSNSGLPCSKPARY